METNFDINIEVKFIERIMVYIIGSICMLALLILFSLCYIIYECNRLKEREALNTRINSLRKEMDDEHIKVNGFQPKSF